MTQALGFTGPRQALDVYERTGHPQPAMYHWRAACRLCDGALETVLTLPSCPLANEYWTAEQVASGAEQDHFPVVLGQCQSCSHVQLQTVVNPERLYSQYSYTSGVAASFRMHLAELATALRAAGHRTIVDIGSNDGTLLAYCRSLGMVGLGVDPARNLAAEASAKGLLTVPAFFNVETARALKGILGRSPDVVVALNSFAHTDSLGEIADGVRELIGETGTFVFEVAYLLDLLEKNEIGSLYHEHVSHHSLGPLLDFFSKRGMTVCDAERIGIQGGSLRVHVRGRLYSLPEDHPIDDILEAEERIPVLLAAWPGRIAEERRALLTELRPYLAKTCAHCDGTGGNHPTATFNGHTHPGTTFGPCSACKGGGDKPKGKLAIYGAPARLTTWTYAMGLKREDVVCVFDDEPRKQGRATPGLHWPIVPSSELMARNPEAILISAWPYASEIKARFPDYRGKWLVPARG